LFILIFEGVLKKSIVQLAPLLRGQGWVKKNIEKKWNLPASGIPNNALFDLLNIDRMLIGKLCLKASAECQYLKHTAMRKSLGFIGGGRITKLLLQGFNNRKVKFKRIVVTDVNNIALERLRNDFPFIKADSASVAASQDIVFLSMEQNMIMDTLGLLRNDFRNDPIIISLVPNINFAKLTLRLQSAEKLVRVLPGSATYINEGYTPVAFAPGFPEADKDDVLDLFGYMGKAIEVPEEKLETYSLMSAILPAYFWYQWKELINMGQEIGLTEQETLDYINESVMSSLHMNYRSGLSQEQIVDLMPVSPIEENEAEVREMHRNRLIALYRRMRPQMIENQTATRTR